jgi:hypothetical protein
MLERARTIQSTGNILDDAAEALGMKNNSQQDEWQTPCPIRAPRRCICEIHREFGLCDARRRACGYCAFPTPDGIVKIDTRLRAVKCQAWF